MFNAIKHLKILLLSPNSLTMFRIIAAPFIVVLMMEPNRISTFLSSLIFSLAALTDYFDGYLARKYGKISLIGKIMDPIADKLIVIFVLIVLSVLKWVPIWITCIIVARELLVTGLRNVVAFNGLDVSSSSLGKYKMGFQIAAIIPLLLHFPMFGLNFHAIGMFLMWLALFFTILSGVDYFLKLKKMLDI